MGSKEELIAAIKFGNEVVAEYKELKKPVPSFVYEKIIELQDDLIEKLL